MANLLERQDYILLQLEQHGKVSVETLAKQLNTSEVTVRKDLTHLETQGLLVRRYGGAIQVKANDKQKISPNNELTKRKLQLADIAAHMIPDGARIIVDGGSTVRALLPLLKSKKDLLVMTNSPSAAVELTELASEPKVLVTGGTWDSVSQSLQGHMAEKMLQAYDFDFAFIGASGIDVTRGTTTYNELTGLTNTMASVSKTVVVMSTSEKLDKRMPNLELSWQQINVLISDSDLSDEVVNQIEQHGVEVKIPVAKN